MKKIALITGATAGIGKACAFKFAENNYNIIMTGRRNKLLEEIADEIMSRYSSDVCILNFDVQKKKDVEKAIASLHAKWKNIDVLVNNAGLAIGMSPIQEGEVSDWETMIDTNFKGLLYISHAVMPYMIKRNKGHIINIGSIAGKEVYANGNVYCATKSAVDALTKAMRIDLLKYNIRVTAVHPGATETEFSFVRFKGDKNKAKHVYDGFRPLSGEDVAQVIFYIASLPEHININDIIVMPTAQANTVHTQKSI